MDGSLAAMPPTPEALDAQSLAHLHALASQSLEHVGIATSAPAHGAWTTAIVEASHELVAGCVMPALAELWATRHACFEAASETSAEPATLDRRARARLPGGGSADGPKLTRTVLNVVAEPTPDARATRRLTLSLGVWRGAALFGGVPHAGESDDWTSIGGTFIIAGGPGKELRKVERVLPLLGFAAMHLALEGSLIRDLGCERVPLPPPSPLPPSEPETPPLPPDSTAEPDPDPVVAPPPATAPLPSTAPYPLARSPHHARRKSLWSFLLGAEQPPPLTKRSSAPARLAKPPTSQRLRDRIRSKLQQPIGGRKRRGSGESAELEDWDMIESDRPPPSAASEPPPSSPAVEKPLPELPVPPASTASVAEEPAEDEGDRYLGVIRRMERAILSTSPSVHFPPPHLLVRLRQQELDEAAAQAAMSARTSAPSMATSASSLSLSPPDHHAHGGRPAIGRQRSFPANDAEALRASFAEHGPADEPASSDMRTPTSSFSKATGARLNIDARAGLASLMTGNASLHGAIQHQSLLLLLEIACPGAACFTRHSTSLPYYHDGAIGPEQLVNGPPSGSDARIGVCLEALAAGADKPCGVNGCERKLREHSISWLHSTSRVQLTFHAASVVNDGGDLQLWTSCNECDAATEPHTASDATKLLSWGKLLELLIYDAGDLTPPEPAFCAHHIDSRHSLVRCFQLRGVVIKLQTSSIEASLFELRLPRAIAVEEPAEAPADEDVAGVSNDPLTTLRSEIRAFYYALHQRTDAVREALTARENPFDSFLLLDTLVKRFADAENDLIGELVKADPSSVNGGRFVFVENAKAAQRRLAAWQEKHLTKDELVKLIPAPLPKPEYFGAEVHALPAGTSVLLREAEPSSLIAFSLSSADYKAELAQPTQARPAPESARWKPPLSRRSSAGAPGESASSQPPSPRLGSSSLAAPSTDTSPPKEPTASRKPPASSLLLPSRSQRPVALDPDDEAADFAVGVSFSSSAHSKGEPKSSSQSILQGLSKKRSNDLFGLFGQRHASDPAGIDGLPSSAASDIGSMRSAPADDRQLLESLLSSTVDDRPSQLTVSSAAGTPHKLPKLIADLSSRRVVSESSGPPSSIRSDTTVLGSSRLIPPSPDRTPVLSARSSIISESLSVGDAGSVMSTLTSPLAAIWSLGSLRSRSSELTSQLGVDEASPHVDLSFTTGSKTFQVTIWHAAKFALLRRLCNLSEASFIESMSRCSSWSPTGGKSRCEFFTSQDKRFILKQMRDSAFSGSEKDSLLGLASQYFSYLTEGDEHRPSLIAKIWGVYSIRTRDEATGADVKRDVIVLESLWAGRDISRVFDLKGIGSRKAPPLADGTAPSTLFDHEFALASRQLLLRPHSRQVIVQAIANDTTFLANASVVDYSALIGVSESARELVVGLIDILSSFGFAKQLESRAKQTLQRRKDEVTIVSPLEYGARFRRSLDAVLVSVPEKFTQQSDTPVGLCSPL